MEGKNPNLVPIHLWDDIVFNINDKKGVGGLFVHFIFLSIQKGMSKMGLIEKVSGCAWGGDEVVVLRRIKGSERTQEREREGESEKERASERDKYCWCTYPLFFKKGIFLIRMSEISSLISRVSITLRYGVYGTFRL